MQGEPDTTTISAQRSVLGHEAQMPCNQQDCPDVPPGTRWTDRAGDMKEKGHDVNNKVE